MTRAAGVLLALALCPGVAMAEDGGKPAPAPEAVRAQTPPDPRAQLSDEDREVVENLELLENLEPSQSLELLEELSKEE